MSLIGTAHANSLFDQEEVKKSEEELEKCEEELDLMKCEEALKIKYADVLREGLPVDHTMVNEPVTIKFKEGIVIKPLFCTKAKLLPLHYKEQAGKMVEDLLEQGVIGKVEGYTQWCSPAAFVPKPDAGLRLVTDC